MAASALGPRSPLAAGRSPPSCTWPDPFSWGSHPPPRPLTLVPFSSFSPACYHLSWEFSHSCGSNYPPCYLLPLLILIPRSAGGLPSSPEPQPRCRPPGRCLLPCYPRAQPRTPRAAMLGPAWHRHRTALSDGQRLPGSTTQSHPPAGRPGGSSLCSGPYVQPVTC